MLFACVCVPACRRRLCSLLVFTAFVRSFDLQVYIFWNFHEEVEGQFNFAGRGNLTLFMQKAAKAGLFVNLRIGPYVCAEWTYGGLPAWLGLKDGVAFRQTNAVWQPAMQKWFELIVDRMAAGKFFASQGGPIVLVQVSQYVIESASQRESV